MLVSVSMKANMHFKFFRMAFTLEGKERAGKFYTIYWEGSCKDL